MEYTKLKLFLWISFLYLLPCLGQESPVEYMNLINQDQEEILSQTWDYLNSIARSGSNAKIEQRRYELSEAINKSAQRVKTLPGYKESTVYRDSVAAYLDFSLDVVKGRTDHLINLEKISQNSFDAMEAYVLYKQLLNEKFQEKNRSIEVAQQEFAARNKVTLIKSENELANKIDLASEVFNYKNNMYLSFFRCAVYENTMLEAFQNPNSDYDYSLLALTVNDLAEQSRAQLDTIQDVNTDLSLRNVTIAALDFFVKEAEKLTPLVLSFNQIKNEFESYKETFSKLSDKEKTKESVETYNNYVEQVNAASQALNNGFNTFNQERAQIYNHWNNTANMFIQKYVPE